jgi:hypothetical protein
MKTHSNSEIENFKEWPTVVYVWAVGLGFLSYLVAEIFFQNVLSHPLRWVTGLIGGLVGLGIGWLWYRWRGDIF